MNNTEPKKSDPDKILLAWLVPIITGFIYAAAYCYQWGLNANFGIPQIFISIDLSKVIYSLIPFFALFYLNYVFLDDTVHTRKLNLSESDDRNLLVRLAVALNGSLIVILVLLFVFGFWWTDILAAIALVMTFFLVRYVVKHHASGIKKLPKDSWPGIIKALSTRYGLIAFIPLYAVTLAMMAWMFGAVSANVEQTYEVVSNNHGEVLLNTYGNNYILGHLNLKNHKLTSELTVVSSSTNITFIPEHIGKLEAPSPSPSSGNKEIRKLGHWLKQHV